MYKQLPQLPEANPIIPPNTFIPPISYTLYALHQIEPFNPKINYDIKDNTQQYYEKSLPIPFTSMPEVCEKNRVIYDKYKNLTQTPLSQFLSFSSEFNQVLCNLSRMSAIRNLLPAFKQQQEILIEEQSSSQELEFDSQFEAGNLSKAVQIGDREYQLILQFDINTKGHTQWFYFRVRNHQTIGHVNFSIINLSKNGHLYTQGMKIAIYSRKDNNGWIRGGENISYMKNDFVKNEDEHWYTLQFTYNFKNYDDEVFFAHSYPYSLNDLQHYLNKIEKSKFLHRSVLCRSVLGNRLEKLTITNPTNPESTQKRGIVIMARVHPGETVSSYMVEGIIDWLLSEEAGDVRANFVVKVIPMLNPDGVIHGNYRCSLTGCDLNRRWESPSKDIHPEIYYAKQLIIEFDKTCSIALVIDLHGHNLKRSVFLYGCHKPGLQSKLAAKQFASLFSTLDARLSFKNCNFAVQKSKQSTARVTLWNELQIPCVFTLEASFFGPEDLPRHFTQQDYREIGRSLCQTIDRYFIENGQLNQNQVKRLRTRQWIQDEQTENNQETEVSSRGSTSQPSKDNLSMDRIKVVLPKKIVSNPTFFASVSVKANLSSPQSPPSSPQKPSTPKKIIVVKKTTQKRLQRVKQPSEPRVKETKEIPMKLYDLSQQLTSKYQQQEEERLQKLLNQIMDKRKGRDRDYQRLKSVIFANISSTQHAKQHRKRDYSVYDDYHAYSQNEISQEITNPYRFLPKLDGGRYQQEQIQKYFLNQK